MYTIEKKNKNITLLRNGKNMWDLLKPQRLIMHIMVMYKI